jgi:hypothetical protein
MSKEIPVSALKLWRMVMAGNRQVVLGIEPHNARRMVPEDGMTEK